MKKYKLLFIVTFSLILSSCQQSNFSKKSSSLSDEEIINNAIEKTMKSKSFYCESVWTLEPANDFYSYSKDTFKGTIKDNDGKDYVCKGTYSQYWKAYDTSSLHKGIEEVNAEVIKEKGQEAKLLQSNRRDIGFGMIDDFIYIELLNPSFDSENRTKYEINKSTENGMDIYTVNTVYQNIKLDDGTPEYDSSCKGIYKINKDGYLVYYSDYSESFYVNQKNEFSDKLHKILWEYNYSQIVN